MLDVSVVTMSEDQQQDKDVKPNIKEEIWVEDDILMEFRPNQLEVVAFDGTKDDSNPIVRAYDAKYGPYSPIKIFNKEGKYVPWEVITFDEKLSEDNKIMPAECASKLEEKLMEAETIREDMKKKNERLREEYSKLLVVLKKSKSNPSIKSNESESNAPVHQMEKNRKSF